MTMTDAGSSAAAFCEPAAVTSTELLVCALRRDAHLGYDGAELRNSSNDVLFGYDCDGHILQSLQQDDKISVAHLRGASRQSWHWRN